MIPVTASAASVDSRAPAFARRVEQWRLMRDFMAGEEALLTEAYIPPLSPDWPKDMKRAYVERAYLFNATEVTVDGFAGMVTVKPPSVTLPPGMQEWGADVTGEGHDTAGLAAICADSLMEVGCVGLLAEYPAAPTGLTVAQATRLGLQPMIAVYQPESILEVRVDRFGGKQVVTRVRLAETFETADGEWGVKAGQRIRVLELVEGVYQQRIFDRSTSTAAWIEMQPVVPLANGQRMTEIPFRLATANGAAFVPPRPPLHTLAQANLKHLRDSALHQHGLAFCAQPVRFFAGIGAPSESPPMVGSSIAVFAQDPNAKASIIEASPDIVGAIVKAMETKARDMAVLGARFLAGDGSAQIAENTARINRSGDAASLSKISDAIEGALQQCLRWCAAFLGIDGADITVQMIRDYMPVRMAPLELQALVAAWQAGAITQSDLYGNLVRGEIIAARQGGPDDYREELEQEAPGMTSVGAV